MKGRAEPQGYIEYLPPLPGSLMRSLLRDCSWHSSVNFTSLLLLTKNFKKCISITCKMVAGLSNRSTVTELMRERINVPMPAYAISRYCRLFGIKINNCYNLSVGNLIDNRLIFDCHCK